MASYWSTANILETVPLRDKNPRFHPGRLSTDWQIFSSPILEIGKIFNCGNHTEVVSGV